MESSKSSKAVGILLETTDVEAIIPRRDFYSESLGLKETPLLKQLIVKREADLSKHSFSSVKEVSDLLLPEDDEKDYFV